MSVLARYRKSGGFSQLLALIESCDSQRQEKLLHLIAVEDPGWVVLVKRKMLTLEKIFSWPPEILASFLDQVPERILVASLYCVEQKTADRVLKSFSVNRSKDLTHLYFQLQLSPAEKSAASIKIIQMVRELEADRKINLKLIDPTLEIDVKLVA